MSQFKKFNASENRNYDSYATYEAGTLTWDNSNGLRIHDGSTGGGVNIGVTSYNQLSDTPQNPANFMSSGSGNNKQFMRYNSGTGQVEYADDFKVVPSSGVAYPAGIIGDKVGDVAFSSNYIYYCKQEPNNLGNVTITSGAGYSNQAWIVITTIPNGTPVAIGNKLTDGTYTAEVQEIIEAWPGYNGSRMIVRIDTATATWHDGTPSTLTVLTSGTSAKTDNWSRFIAVSQAPAHNNTPGTQGQIAFDDNYMYRCATSNVTAVSYNYNAPYGQNTSPYNWPNQSSPTALRLFENGDPAPQIGWHTYDGTNMRTITNVLTQNSGFGPIYDLTLDSSVDYSTAITITVYQTLAVDAIWKRTPLNADTW